MLYNRHYAIQQPKKAMDNVGFYKAGWIDHPV